MEAFGYEEKKIGHINAKIRTKIGGYNGDFWEKLWRKIQLKGS